MKYFGDILEDAKIHIPFNTNNGNGASVTFTGTTVKVYKDAATGTESVAGVTLSKDHDGITGTHLVTIVSSADAFYATGSDYQVELQAATIDSQTVNAWLGAFSIENRSAALATDIVTAGAIVTNGGAVALVDSVNTTGTVSTNVGVDWSDVSNPTSTVGLTNTTIGITTANTDMLTSTDVWNEDISGIATANSAGGVVNATLVDTGTTIPATLTEMQGAAFDSATDSLKSIRDRGDAAWITGGGSATIPPSIR